VPLGDIGEYFAWIERESPSVAAQHAVRSFLLELDGRPWAAPNMFPPDGDCQPSGHIYASGDVDILVVTLL
jgi:hypothetical protein